MTGNLLLASSFALGLLLIDAAFNHRNQLPLSAAARAAIWAISLLGYVASLARQIVAQASDAGSSPSLLLYLGPILILLLLPLIWRQLGRLGGNGTLAAVSDSSLPTASATAPSTEAETATAPTFAAFADPAAHPVESEAAGTGTGQHSAPPAVCRAQLLRAVVQGFSPPLRSARQALLDLKRSSSVANDAQAQVHIEGLDAALDGADGLLDSFNQLIRLDDGALQPQSAPYAARAFCQSLYAPLAELAEQRQLELRWQAADLILLSDRELLQQVVRPLLSNALRFTRYGGVLLAVRRRGEQALLQIWDTGPGMPGEQVERAFDEFETLESVSPWGERGLGLGLALSRRLADRLNLPLRLRSRLGRGSLVELWVPLAAPGLAEMHDIRERNVKLSPITRALQVLCLDQDPKHLAELVARLRSWTVSVDAAADLEQALLCLDQRPADLLLVDHQPDAELDGFALIEILIRQRQPTPAYALLAADINEALQLRADSAGIPLLSKPVSPAPLRALVEATLSNRH